MSGIALITASAVFERNVRSALGTASDVTLRRWREEYLRIDPSKVVAEMAQEEPDLVSLGPGLDTDAALDLAAAFDRDHPEISVIIVAEPSPEMWERALRCGARDVLAPNASATDLKAAIERAVERAERRRSNTLKVVQPSVPTAAARIITVLSPKGGSGKTTIATNVAVGLSRLMSGRVAIVDLDLQFGDIAAALQLDPEHSMADVSRVNEPLDSTMAKVFLTSHHSGLFALCAPPTPAEADSVGFEAAANAIQILASEFPIVIVDTCAGLGEETLAAIDISTDLLLVCSMDVASVRSLRKEVDAIDSLGMTTQRRHFVLNRADARVGLEPPDIEAVVGLRVDCAIPSSRAVPLSMNQGVPLIESDPRSPVSRQIDVLVRRFAEQAGWSLSIGGPSPAMFATATPGPVPGPRSFLRRRR